MNFKLKHTLYGHNHGVVCVGFSPNNEMLISGAGDETVRVWQVKDGHQLHILKHRGAVRSVTFSPDGRLLASGSFDSTVIVWQVDSGKLLKVLEGHTRPVASVAFSPIGGFLASGSWDKTIKVWSLVNFSHITLSGHTDCVNSVKFSPNGSYIVSTADSVRNDDRYIRLWKSSNGIPLMALKPDQSTVSVGDVAFSKNGKRLAVVVDDMVYVWAIPELITQETSTQWDRIWVAGIETICIDFSPDGRLIASGTRDRSIHLWNAENGVHLGTLEGHNDLVMGVCFSADGRFLASCSNDNTIRVWEANA